MEWVGIKYEEGERMGYSLGHSESKSINQIKNNVQDAKKNTLLQFIKLPNILTSIRIILQTIIKTHKKLGNKVVIINYHTSELEGTPSRLRKMHT